MKEQLSKLWRLLSLPKNLQLSIMRLTQNEFLIGVTGVILNERNEVLICKHIYRQNKWSLPGGYIKGKEHPKEGLEREVFEESSLTISADERMKIRTDRDTARLDITYIGTFIGGEFKPSGEVTNFGFFSMDTLPLIPKNQLLLIEQAMTSKHDQ